MAIRILSAQLASQIAAGEVVEHPASVVKELVENALDAGARSVTIEVRNGGRELIQVADDGEGIAGDELETAFMRHATSKLQSADQLAAIRTLGFRGEALAAIAAVSQVTVVSRAAGAQAGTRLVLEGGRVTGRELVGAPAGTVIAMENLFFNVPARLKFLKSASAEKRRIDEFVTRYALAYPHVRVRLAHNGRITFQTTGNGDMQEALLAYYGPEVARQLLPLDGVEPERTEGEKRPAIRVSGYIGPPGLHWANRNHITLFVNGRWIHDTTLTYAVTQAYRTLLPTGRYPLGFIFIALPEDQVDVNVHPAKTEVRFRDNGAVFSAVQRTVRRALIEDSPVRSLTTWGHDDERDGTPAGWSGTLPSPAREQGDAARQDELHLDWSRHFAADDAARPTPAVPGSGEWTSGKNGAGGELSGSRLPIMRIVGQVGAAFIITEGPEGMYLIDQHAAHERILYEQFMAQRARDEIVSQKLLSGQVIYLPPPLAALLDENLTLLAGLGFELEPFGPQGVMVRAVPALIAHLDPEQALLAALGDLEQEQDPLQEAIEGRIVLRVCKSAAVKAGKTLSLREMEALVGQLEACQNPHTCPHGRPTLIHLSVSQLARQFGRT